MEKYASATGQYQQITAEGSPKTQPELRARLHSFQSAVEHLDTIHVRLTRIRDRLSGPTPQAVSDERGKQGLGIGERPILHLYTEISEEIKGRISWIRAMIDEIEKTI